MQENTVSHNVICIHVLILTHAYFSGKTHNNKTRRNAALVSFWGIQLWAVLAVLEERKPKTLSICVANLTTFAYQNEIAMKNSYEKYHIVISYSKNNFHVIPFGTWK